MASRPTWSGAPEESHDAVALHGALALWRGEPLTGLPGEWAARMREAWRQQWLDAVVAWARAELTADNHHAVLGPLTELVDQYPSVEPLAAALIRAIRAAGRDAEALQRYQTIRQRLADQLGVDPGDELRGLYEDILRADRQRAAAPGRRPAAVPAQLPLSVPGFTGRAGELAQLDKILAEASTAVVISALSGTAGVGKPKSRM